MATRFTLTPGNGRSQTASPLTLVDVASSRKATRHSNRPHPFLRSGQETCGVVHICAIEYRCDRERQQPKTSPRLLHVNTESVEILLRSKQRFRKPKREQRRVWAASRPKIESLTEYGRNALGCGKRCSCRASRSHTKNNRRPQPSLPDSHPRPRTKFSKHNQRTQSAVRPAYTPREVQSIVQAAFSIA